MLSEEAEAKLKEKNMTISQPTRERLAQMTPKEQVQWIANPYVMYIIQQYMNEVYAKLGNMRAGGAVSTTATNNEPKPDDDNVSDDGSSSSSTEIFGGGLFG